MALADLPYGKLAPHEVEIARLLLQGKGNKEIAAILNKKSGSVDKQVGHICDKMLTRSKFVAAQRAQELGQL